MKPKERVYATFRHEEPDKVPCTELRINPHIINALVKQEEQERKFCDQNFVTHTSKGCRDSIMHAKASVALGLDLLTIWPDELDERNEYVSEDKWIDELGKVWKSDSTPGAAMGQYMGGMVNSWEKVDKYCPALDPQKRMPSKKLRELFKKYGDYAFMWIHDGPLEMTYESMGLQNFCQKLYDDLPLVKHLFKRRTQFFLSLADHIIQLGVDFIVIGDDAAYHSGPLFSPQLYKEIVIPAYEMIVHELSVPIILHSDGYIIPLLSMIRDVGIKAIHPLEVTANIDLKEVKKEFGQDLVLMGNADCSYILCQTDKQLIHKEVERCIFQGAPGGGYVFCSSNSLHAGVPVESAIETFQYANRIGWYDDIRKKA